MIREKSAGAVIYRVSEDGTVMYLLLQAVAGKPWGFPKGKLDRGETEDQAARREIAEESGLTQVTFDPLFRFVVQYTYRIARALVKKEVVYFLASVNTSEIHLSWEHVAYMWAPLEEAIELVHFENARELLLAAHTHLGGELPEELTGDR